MNKSIVRRCLEALEQESPDISFVRGMLFALVEMEEKPVVSSTKPINIANGGPDFIVGNMPLKNPEVIADVPMPLGMKEILAKGVSYE